MMHQGRVISRTELVEHLYDQDFDRDSNTIEVFVGRLRKKIGSDRIETVRGLGYRLIALEGEATAAVNLRGACWRPSLARRLVLLAAIWSVAVLLVTGVALTALFQREAVDRFDDGLLDTVNGLYAGSSVDDERRGRRPAADRFPRHPRLFRQVLADRRARRRQAARPGPLALAVGQRPGRRRPAARRRCWPSRRASRSTTTPRARCASRCAPRRC